MIAAPPITFNGDRLQVHFDHFGIESYSRFLDVKRLPESDVTFHPDTETYTVSAPKRFASLLGAKVPDLNFNRLPYPSWFYDDQAAIVDMILDAKRFACWSGLGNGKTLIELEAARQITHITGGGRVLIVTLNDIVPQFIQMAEQFYGDSLPIVRLETRKQMREWCKEGPGTLAIVNYEKFNPDEQGQVISELRDLAGLILDESSKLKASGGKQKWALIKSSKGIEYKIAATATPAPNDVIEFASQASFLERMRSDNEIIWTYFYRHPKTHRWAIRPHARKAFFEFMSSWSIYVRDPRRYGWRKDHPDVPAPIVRRHEIDVTPEQRERLQKMSGERSGQIVMFQAKDTNTIQRAKLSQIAKGFRYRKDDEEGEFERIFSRKPGVVADLTEEHLANNLQVIIWTVFNAESQLICDRLRDRGIRFEPITGSSGTRLPRFS